MRCSPPLALLAVLLGAGCPSADTPDPSYVTWTEDVRPLVTEYCVGCHVDGGAGPFSLSNYEDAARWASASAQAVAARTMPPFLADGSGDCHTWKNNRWLSEAQIRVFEDWVASETPEGPELAPPTPPELPVLAGDIETVDIGADYVPSSGATDDYRCFVVDSPGTFAATGFEVVPGNPEIVHHLIAYQVTSEASADEARQLDEDSDGPGYACLGTGPQIDDYYDLAGWAPGLGAEIFPEGTGIEIDGDLPLIIEMHYNVVAEDPAPDRTALRFSTVPLGTVRPIVGVAGWDFDFVAPPGLASWSTTELVPVSWSLPDGYQGEVTLLGVNAHMHQRGVSTTYSVLRGDGPECLLDIPRWDFDWQLTYWYSEPVTVQSNAMLSITCSFDTTGLDGPLTWGERTEDEMCLAGFYAVLED